MKLIKNIGFNMNDSILDCDKFILCEYNKTLFCIIQQHPINNSYASVYHCRNCEDFINKTFEV